MTNPGSGQVYQTLFGERVTLRVWNGEVRCRVNGGTEVIIGTPGGNPPIQFETDAAETWAVNWQSPGGGVVTKRSTDRGETWV